MLVRQLEATHPDFDVPIGEPGCKERVDFGFVIGLYVKLDARTGRVVRRAPTTVGTIHYAKKGIHIVPARPKDE